MADEQNTPAPDSSDASQAATDGDAAPVKPAAKTAKKTAKKAAKKKAKKKASKKTTTKKAASSSAASKKTTKKKKKASSKIAGKGKKLVIVESPAKAKTINKYLGASYVVKASVGHVRDLPKSKLGVDVEHDFEPQYLTIRGKKEVIDELKRYARGAKEIFLATDPDREGEAIAWHLKEGLQLDPAITHRVTFNEITKAAIQRAFEHPTEIGMDVVNAQQARRILDRLVGYSISPLLWRKITKGLSAGRVQSVAQRLICEREDEIKVFDPVEYWSISAFLMKLEAAKKLSADDRAKLNTTLAALHGEEIDDADLIDSDEEVDLSEQEEKAKQKPVLPDYVFRADLKKWKGETPSIDDEAQANAIISSLENAPFTVSKIETKERKDRPKAPFITSTLQQAASNQLGFTARRTMRAAQGLYEGMDIGAEGAAGLITYMRTDSVHLSDFAMNDAREVIEQSFGKEYMPEERVIYKTNSKAQAAHEAIRPTSAYRTPDSIKEYLNADQYKLYKLIWERFIACQMVPALYLVTTMEIEAGEGLFRLSGKRLKFEGHARVSGLKLDSGEQLLPELEEQEKLDCGQVKGDQHFTQPPPRFTEASLVRTLEKLGIGRPSTYATIISTLTDRGYAKLEARRFFATELGQIVNKMVSGNFQRIVDSDFTAKMESQLDKIEEGKLDWVDVMRNFYALFKEELAEAEEKIESIKGTPALDSKGNAVHCPLCEKEMLERWSKNGKFYGCCDYPECKGTLPVGENGDPIQLKKEDIECPDCGSDMVVRIGKRGPFLGCSTFPACRGTRALEAAKTPEEKQAEEEFAGLSCDKCGSGMSVKIARGRPFLGCDSYPDCKNALSIKKVRDKLTEGEIAIDEEVRAKKLAEIKAERDKQEGLQAPASA